MDLSASLLPPEILFRVAMQNIWAWKAMCCVVGPLLSGERRQTLAKKRFCRKTVTFRVAEGQQKIYSVETKTWLGKRLYSLDGAPQTTIASSLQKNGPRVVFPPRDWTNFRFKPTYDENKIDEVYRLACETIAMNEHVFAEEGHYWETTEEWEGNFRVTISYDSRRTKGTKPDLRIDWGTPATNVNVQCIFEEGYDWVCIRTKTNQTTTKQSRLYFARRPDNSAAIPHYCDKS